MALKVAMPVNWCTFPVSSWYDMQLQRCFRRSRFYDLNFGDLLLICITYPVRFATIWVTLYQKDRIFEGILVERFANEKTVVEGLLAENTVNKKIEADLLLVKLLEIEDL